MLSKNVQDGHDLQIWKAKSHNITIGGYFNDVFSFQKWNFETFFCGLVKIFRPKKRLHNNICAETENSTLFSENNICQHIPCLSRSLRPEMQFQDNILCHSLFAVLKVRSFNKI